MKKYFFFLLLLTVTLFTSELSLMANTWTGANSTDFTTGANWNPNFVPYYDTASFEATVSNNPTINSMTYATIDSIESRSESVSLTLDLGSTLIVYYGANILEGTFNLINNGASFFANANVSQGATFSGIGSLISITNSGTVTVPAVGTSNVLSLTSSYTQNNGGIYKILLDPAKVTQIQAISAIINSGSVVNLDASSNLEDGTYPILITTNPLVGNFSSTVGNVPSGYQATLSYEDHRVLLTITSNIPPVPPVPGLTSLVNNARTCSEFAVAHELDNIVNPTTAQSAIISTLTALTPSQITMALDSLSGSQYGINQTAQDMSNRQFLRRLYDPLRPIVTKEPYDYQMCCDEPNDNFDLYEWDYEEFSGVFCDTPSHWFELGGGNSQIRDKKNGHKSQFSTYELSLGVQANFLSLWTGGVAFSYENKQQKRNSLGSQSIKTWMGGLYGLYRPNGYYVLGDIAFGGSDSSLKRIISMGPTSYKTHSKPKSFQTVLYSEAGFDIQSYGFLIQPFLGAQLSVYQLNKIKETGTSDWNLSVNGKTKANLYSRLGLHITTEPSPCEMGLSLDLSWNCQLTNSHNNSTVKFDNLGSDFSVCGANVDKNSIEYALTFTKFLCYNLEIYVEASGESFVQASTFNALAGIKYIW